MSFPEPINRRRFLKTGATAGASLTVWAAVHAADPANPASVVDKPSILGGKKIHPEPWPEWPVFDETEAQALDSALSSRQWYRYFQGAEHVSGFEDAFAKYCGARHCLCTSSGTNALFTVLGAMDIGPGDEVIIPAYTFIGVYNVVALHHALPVFSDIDPETFQMEPSKVEAAIGENTKAIMPAYIGGHLPDMDRLMAVANRAKIPVIEDACQAPSSEWRGRLVGNQGVCGCFSFQGGKCLPAGEGGLITTNDTEFAHRCELFHNQGKPRKTAAAEASSYPISFNRGTNVRMSEWHGAVLKAQLSRFRKQSATRWENGLLLNSLLAELPGIQPAKVVEGCTRSTFYLYMFRYDPQRFENLPRARFVKALNQEGVPATAGFGPLHKDPYVTGLDENRHFKKLYPKESLERWRKQLECPATDALCGRIVCLPQNVLLGSRSEMEQVAAAIRRVQAHAGAILKV